MRYNPVQCIEFFHLIFLDFLSRKLDKRLYALKGGCNLRFFLKSIRYSQDIDLDVKTVGVATLQKTVNAVLKSQSLSLMLKSHSLEIAHLSESKQTDTTQRWKIQLKTESAVIFPTKIEFSRKNLDTPVCFEPIDSNILNAYHLHPIFVSHYNAETAFKQKIVALASRTETQARDVWDLFHLINAYKVQASEEQYLIKACENACSITFSDFKDQVLAFLPSDLQTVYNQETWDKIQLTVVEYLEQKK